jgi:hypothetical protein
MKFKTYFIIIITGLALAAGSGCDKDDGPTDSNPAVPPELVDTWVYQSATINGVPINLSIILQWHVGTETARFTVGEDESFLEEELDGNGEVNWFRTGTFTVDGNSATITVTADSDGPVDPDTLSGTWELDGDELTLTTDYQGATVVFVALRIAPLP